MNYNVTINLMIQDYRSMQAKYFESNLLSKYTSGNIHLFPFNFWKKSILEVFFRSTVNSYNLHCIKYHYYYSPEAEARKLLKTYPHQETTPFLALYCALRREKYIFCVNSAQITCGDLPKWK